MKIKVGSIIVKLLIVGLLVLAKFIADKAIDWEDEEYDY